MSEKNNQINCKIHGKRPITYICQHLANSLRSGQRVGFNLAHDPGNSSPDAWCDECEKVVMQSGGEWDDESEEFAGITIVCADCYDKAKFINTTASVCPQCGKVHDELPLDLAYQRPADYFKIPESERTARIDINDDICIIDASEFYVRGVLELPIKDTDKSFGWGVWARVNKSDLRRYFELWNVENTENEPPFEGKLSGGLKYYPDSDLLDVTVHLQPKAKRPLFKVISNDHPLGIDQKEGITMEKVHYFFGL